MSSRASGRAEMAMLTGPVCRAGPQLVSGHWDGRALSRPVVGPGYPHCSCKHWSLRSTPSSQSLQFGSCRRYLQEQPQ